MKAHAHRATAVTLFCFSMLQHCHPLPIVSLYHLGKELKLGKELAEEISCEEPGGGVHPCGRCKGPVGQGHCWDPHLSLLTTGDGGVCCPLPTCQMQMSIRDEERDVELIKFLLNYKEEMAHARMASAAKLETLLGVSCLPS